MRVDQELISISVYLPSGSPGDQVSGGLAGLIHPRAELGE
jgi:hypothetical protein